MMSEIDRASMWNSASGNFCLIPWIVIFFYKKIIIIDIINISIIIINNIITVVISASWPVTFCCWARIQKQKYWLRFSPTQFSGYITRDEKGTGFMIIETTTNGRFAWQYIRVLKIQVYTIHILGTYGSTR